MLFLVLVLVLVLLVLFHVDGDMGVLFGEDAGDVDSNVVVDHDRVILAYSAHTEFLGWEVSNK
jgi:hypothetical protein